MICKYFLSVNDMISALLLSSLLCGFSYMTLHWGEYTGTTFPGVIMAGLLKGLHRRTHFAPTASLLEVYLQEVVKDVGKDLVMWIATLTIP